MLYLAILCISTSYAPCSFSAENGIELVTFWDCQKNNPTFLLSQRNKACILGIISSLNNNGKLTDANVAYLDNLMQTPADTMFLYKYIQEKTSSKDTRKKLWNIISDIQRKKFCSLNSLGNNLSDYPKPK